MEFNQVSDVKYYDISYHIFFADDITLFSPSLTGLQELVDVCYDYALSHDIVFNCNKSRGMFLHLITLIYPVSHLY